MLTVSLLARISATTHHATSPIITGAVLVLFVIVAAMRFGLRRRGFNMNIGGRGRGEGANPFNQSGGTMNQIDRTL